MTDSASNGNSDELSHHEKILRELIADHQGIPRREAEDIIEKNRHK